LLSQVPAVLPRSFPAPAAEQLAAALREAGTEAGTLQTPSASSVCGDHPTLEAEGACERCGVRTCRLCRLLRAASRCGACERRLQRARHFKWARVAVLLVLLLAAAAWALRVQRRRDGRTTWTQPLQVAVVLVTEGEPDADAAQALHAAVPRLQEWFSREYARYRPDGLDVPVQLTVYGRGWTDTGRA
jgi:hypothetical protein